MMWKQYPGAKVAESAAAGWVSSCGFPLWLNGLLEFDRK